MTPEKRFLALRVGIPVLVAAAMLGCPSSLTPSLSVTPSVLNFGADGVEESLGIFNSGGGTLTWTVEESISWLACDVSEGSADFETDHVTLTVDRSGLGPGNYNGSVLISSNGGSRTVAVAMRVPGASQLQVSPTTLNFLDGQSSADVTLENTGDEALSWTVEVLDPQNPANVISPPDYLTLTPPGGNLAAGAQSTLAVEIDREILGQGPAQLLLRIQSNGGSPTITVNVSTESEAALVVEPTTLDFGERLSQMTFDVYNNGPAGSEMSFTVTTDRPEFIFLNPTSGSSTGTDELVKDKVTIAATLDRSKLNGAEDSGHIYVTVVGLEPVEVLVTAKAAPIVFEGAINRTRPPFILRFVFTLRDSTGRAINANDENVLSELQTSFSLYEDTIPLDTDETNFFVNNGRNLKYNVVLMLDYTGSMFEAGAGHGEAIDQMVASSKEFVNDLPPSYRLAVMEYHERQQANRLIHGFSTTRDAINQSIDAFQVPDAEHGASEILDALMDACDRLVKEDENVLPFDDTDVRAIVFISDGRDTSSITTQEQLIQTAKEAGVRLYPIGFGQGINSSMLINLATETGGHYYAAPTVEDLQSLLAHESAGEENAPGLVVTELDRQVVLTYITLWQEGTHTYTIRADYRGQTGFIDRDGVFAIGGDIRAGQIALTTAGIEPDGTAEVFVRTDYVPRNVTQFRFRVVAGLPYTIEPVADGLASDWSLVDEGGGVYTLLTTEDRPLRYGAFGNLLKLTFSQAQGLDFFDVGFRIDNRIYVNPPFTKFFVYPLGVRVSRETSSTASAYPAMLDDGFDPDAPNAWDHDGDAIPDFDDPYPDDPELP